LGKRTRSSDPESDVVIASSGEASKGWATIVRLLTDPVFVIAVIRLKDENFLKKSTDVCFIDEERSVSIDLRV